MTMTMYHLTTVASRTEWVEVAIPLFIRDDDELHAQYVYVHTLNSTGQVPNMISHLAG